jgi:hypothetical protein
MRSPPFGRGEGALVLRHGGAPSRLIWALAEVAGGAGRALDYRRQVIG